MKLYPIRSPLPAFTAAEWAKALAVAGGVAAVLGIFWAYVFVCVTRIPL